MLHDDRFVFEQIVLRVSEATGIAAGIIEKDYYVTLFLQRIAKLQPNIIFKGGTSLSKCYKLIDRFSEDIDLNVETETSARPTEGQRKKLKANIVSIIDDLGFTLANPDDVRSRRDYNRYIIDYPSVFTANYLKEHLVVETAVYIRAYPCQKMMATSIIYDYLHDNGYADVIEQYQLEPFAVNVQIAERTLIDKLYALGDYYLCDSVREHSRHIYDIYKLLTVVELNDALKQLIKDVFEERKNHVNCHSAKDGIDMGALLQEIIDKDVYKNDYEEITAKMLFDKVDYSTAITALQKVVDSGIFH